MGLLHNPIWQGVADDLWLFPAGAGCMHVDRKKEGCMRVER